LRKYNDFVVKYSKYEKAIRTSRVNCVVPQKTYFTSPLCVCNTSIGQRKRSTINRLENFSRTSSGHPNKRQKLDSSKKTSAKEN
jgi:hypothetical protein